MHIIFGYGCTQEFKDYFKKMVAKNGMQPSTLMKIREKYKFNISNESDGLLITL